MQHMNWFIEHLVDNSEKLQIIVRMLTRSNHISLQQQLVNCKCKMFYDMGFRQLLQQSATVKTFMFKAYDYELVGWTSRLQPKKLQTILQMFTSANHTSLQ